MGYSYSYGNSISATTTVTAAPVSLPNEATASTWRKTR